LIALSVGLYVDRVVWEVQRLKERERKAEADMQALIIRLNRGKKQKI